MKKLLLVALFPLMMLFGAPWGNIVRAQMNTVQIGTGTSSDYTLPFNMASKISYNQMVYTQEEIGEAGYIGAIAFDKSNKSGRTIQELTIWMALTSDTIATNTSWVPQTAMKQVFHATDFQLPGVSGDVMLMLDSSFYYDGTQNLAIIVSRKDDGKASWFKFRYTTTDVAMCMYRSDDSDTTVANYPGSAEGTTSMKRPNVKMYMNNADAFCFSVASMEVTSASESEIGISWVKSAGVTGYEVGVLEVMEGVDIDMDLATTTAVAATDSTFTFTSLNMNTEYVVGVRKQCSADLYSEWVTKRTRTTTMPVGVPYVCDFESEDEWGNWVLDNGEMTNKWVIDTAAHCGEGSVYGMFISNDSTEANAYGYDNKKTNTVFAKCLLQFTTEGEYNVKYDWKGVGESKSDYMRVMLVPASYAHHMAPGTSLPSQVSYNKLPVGVIALDEGQMNVKSDWQHYRGVVDVPTAGNYYMMFMWRNDGIGGEGPAAVDNISVEQATCPSADSVKATNITATSATITGYCGAHNNFILYYREMGTELYDSVEMVSPYTLNGLKAGTYYEGFLRTNCGAEDQSWKVVDFQFATNCAVITLPWEFGFEGQSEAVAGSEATHPYCWSAIDTGASVTYTSYCWQVSNESDEIRSGKQGIIFEGASTTTRKHNDWLITPMITFTGNEELSFWARAKYGFASDSYKGRFALYASNANATGSTDTANFEQLNITGTNVTENMVVVSGDTWTNVKIQLPDSLTGSHYLAFAIKDVNSNSFFIDDIYLYTTTSCAMPDSLHMVSSTENSATLAWTGSAASYKVYYGEPGFSTATATMMTSTENSITLTGLSANTTYEFRVVAVCADGISSAITAAASFATTCASIATESLPFTENFSACEVGESAPFVDCWFRGTNGGDVTPYVYSSGSIKNCLYFESKNNVYSYVALPAFEADLSDLMLKCKVRRYHYDRYHSALLLGVMTNPYDYSTFTVYDTLTPTTPREWSEFMVSLANFDATDGKYLAFVLPAGKYEYSYLDDIEISLRGSCDSPMDVRVEELTATTAKVAWNDTVASAWKLYYGTPGFDANTVTPIDVVDTSSYTITGLNPQTNYEFFVVADCGDGSFSATSLTIPFKTNCAPIATLPYVENFENYLSGTTAPISECWTRGVIGTDGTQPYPATDAAINGSKGLRMLGTSSYGEESNGYVALPLFEEDLTNLQLNFNMKNYEGFYHYITYYSKIAMGVMTDPNDLTTFDTLMVCDMSDLPNNTVNAYEYIFSSYTGEGRYIAFRTLSVSAERYSDVENISFIDDVVVKRLPSCHAPEMAQMIGRTGTTATLTWLGNAPAYEVKYSTAADMSNSTSVIVNNDTATLTDLTPSTIYFVDVRGICSDTDTSAWMMERISFRTDVSCGEGYEHFVDTIGNGTSSTSDYVLNCSNFYTYGKTWTIFGAGEMSELGLVGTNNLIKAVSLHVDGTGDTIPFKMYMAETAVDEFDANITDTMALSQMTLVFDDTLVFENDGWTEILLSTPFAYTGASNLMVAFDRSVATDAEVNFFYSNTSKYRTAYINNSSYGVSDGRKQYRGNMIFNICGDVPSCVRPSDVTIADFTSTSISLSWTGNAAGYQIAYGEENFNPDSVATTELLSVTGNATTLQNLIPNTTYYIYMRSACGSEYSNWTSAVEAYTPCDAVVLPYVEDFDAYPATTSISAGQTINPCWVKGTNGTIHYPYVSTSHAASAPNSLNFVTSTAFYNYVALPMFNEPVSNIAMTFKLYKTSANYGTMYVGVMSNPRDINTFEHLTTVKPEEEDVWENFEYSFADYTGNGKFIAFVAPDSLRSYTYLDDVEVFEIPTCQSPINVTVADITQTSAKISWTDRSVNPSAGYQIEYGPRGFELGTGTSIASTTNPTTLNNLAVGSTYDVYVRAKCSATDESRWSFCTTFSTECGPMALPLYYGFEDAVADNDAPLPHCFNRYNDATASYAQKYPYINDYTSDVHTGNNYLYWSLSSYNGAENAAMIFPEIDIVNYPMDGNQIVFWAKRDNSIANIVVAISNSATSIEGLTIVDTIALTSEYVEYTVPFTTYTSEHAYPVLLAHRGGSSQYIYVDDVVIEKIPACARVYDLRAVTATATTATLGWTDTIGSTQWVIDYRQADAETITTVAANANPFTITGLTSSTQYIFNVRPICASGDTSSAVREDATFWTTQVPATVPYTYDFEEATEWANWQTNSNCDVNWYRGNAVATQGTQSMYISADQGATYSGNWNRRVNAVVYRDIDFGSDTSSFTMTFKANAGGTTERDCDGLAVMLVDPTLGVEASNNLSTTPWGSVETVAMTTIRLDTTWGSYVVHFERVSGVHRVAFYWYNTSSADYYEYIDQPGAIDDIAIVEQTCLRPYNLTVSNLEATTATLSWNGAAANYEVAYSEATEGATEIRQVVNGNSLNISNLTPITTYRFKVRSICSDTDTSYWTDAESFKTICSRYVANDTIREDFTNWYACAHNDEDGVLPDCWEAYTSGTNGVMPHVVGEGSYWYAHGDKALVMTSGSATSYGNTNIVRLPYTIEPVSTLTLSYWMATESDQNGTLEIGYVTGTDLATDFVAVKSIPASAATKHDGSGNQDAGVGVYDTIIFDAAPANAQAIAFRWSYHTSYYSVCIDDVVVSADITCPTPIISSTIVDYQSAALTWDGSATNYQLLYKEAASANWNDTIAVAGNTYTINGLMPETAYDVMIRALCGAEDGNSMWAEANFTTDDLPCFTPTNLTVSDINYEDATLDWEANENAQRWVVNVFNTASNVMDTVEAHPTTISGLFAGIEYNVAVKSICSDLISSEWSDTITFTTKVCPTVSNVTVSDITENTANVNWTAGGEEAAWQLQYGPQGFGQGEGEIIDANTTTYTLTGLEAETAYDVYVRAMCTEEYSSVWSEVVTFTTLETPEGIDGVNGNFQFNIYPNPTSNATTISLNGLEGKVVISVVDMNGRTIANESVECGVDCEKRIDVTNLAQGTYFVRVLGDNINSVRKLIVR